MTTNELIFIMAGWLLLAIVIAAIVGEGTMTESQRAEQDLITKTTIYHLGLEGVEVTEAQARNLAGHLQLVVPEFRELAKERTT